MPALDRCQPQVVRALEKEGWVVSPFPYTITLFKRQPFFIDIQAWRDDESLLGEIKCFETSSQVGDLYTGIGQYAVYRGLLERINVDTPLYFIVPLTAYNGIIRRVGMSPIQKMAIKLIVIDMVKETVE